MNCPHALAVIILEILYLGILAARAWASNGETERAHLEADHIHNLPSLLKNYSPDLLKYYWETERPTYIQAHSRFGNPQTGFESLWEQMRIADPTLKSNDYIAAEGCQIEQTSTFD